MAKSEAQRLREARRALSFGRLQLASTAVVAALVLMLVAWLLGNGGKTMWIGTLLAVVAAYSLFVGRALGRAVLPAFAIGLIPFSALLAIQALTGNGCHMGGCATLCLPTCVLSGLIAGGLLAFVSIRVRATLAFVGAAAGMIWLVGALGCPCVGVSSLVGMAAGIAVPAGSVIPRLLEEGRG
ncbi:MAG: hypothetical protein AAF436_06570 [Myxococcota bacterium]